MDHGGDYVFLAISRQHPDRIRVGRSAEIDDARDADWKIAYARRVAFPQTIERIMRDHLSRLGGPGTGAGEFAAPYGHAQLVLDSLIREFGAA